jgi:hypothetical protein
MTPLTRSRNRARFFGAGGAGGTWLTTGPTLDLAFAGVPLDLDNPNGDSIDLEFIPQNYQVATQYSIWEPGMALVSKNFSDIITFTRASSATYFDATGTLQTATTDAPRFDYNPSTLAANGLLIEEARTNLALQSQDFATTWTPSAASISVDVEVSPDGTSNADKLIEDNTTSTHTLGQVFSFTSGVTYAVSIFAKAAERTRIEYRAGNTTTFGARAIFDLSAGTVVQTTSGTASIQSIGNGWYRCIIVGASAATASTNMLVYLVESGTTTNYLGDGTSGVYIWGAQLEAGAFPTSYIPTTSSAVTRAADVASVNTLSPWFSAAEGTLYAEWTRGYTGNFSNYSGQATLLSGASQAIAAALTVPGSTAIYNSMIVGGVQQLTYQAVTTLTTNKVALAYAENNTQWAGNGVSKPTDTVCSVPTVTSLALGYSATGTSYLNGYLRRVSYYPRRLSQAELITITTT